MIEFRGFVSTLSFVQRSLQLTFSTFIRLWNNCLQRLPYFRTRMLSVITGRFCNIFVGGPSAALQVFCIAAVQRVLQNLLCMQPERRVLQTENQRSILFSSLHLVLDCGSFGTGGKTGAVHLLASDAVTTPTLTHIRVHNLLLSFDFFACRHRLQVSSIANSLLALNGGCRESQQIEEIVSL